MMPPDSQHRQPPITVYIGLGSNIEPRAASLKAAIEMIASQPEITGLRQSSVFETEPVDMNDNSGMFLNQVAAGETTLSPDQFLAVLHTIELQLGRTNKSGRIARSIDLDLLLYGDQVLNSPHLTLPHPRLCNRLFVLDPLLEIAPNLVHPVTHLPLASNRDTLRRTLNPSQNLGAVR